MNRLVVIIPTHGRSTLLDRTLRSLGACEIPPSYQETIVVENGSKAGAERVVREAADIFPHLKLRYMHLERANKSHALNEAIETLAPDALVVFLDDDIVVDTGLLMAYESAAQKNGPNHYFGGPFSARYEVMPPEWLRQSFPLSALGCTASELHDIDFVLGFNWAAFIGDIRNAGAFNPNFGPGSRTAATGQETEMQTRMKALGCKRVVVEDALVEHYVPRSRASAQWVIHRRYRLGVSSGYRIAKGARENTMLSGISYALRSVVVLPVWILARNPQRVFGHKLTIARAAGLIMGYIRAFHARH